MLQDILGNPPALLSALGFSACLYILVQLSRIQTVTVRRNEVIIPFVDKGPIDSGFWVQDYYKDRERVSHDESLDLIRSRLSILVDAVSQVYQEQIPDCTEIEAHRLAVTLVAGQSINLLRDSDDKVFSAMISSIAISDPSADRARQTLSDLARKDIVARERSLIRKPLSGVSFWLWIPTVLFGVTFLYLTGLMSLIVGFAG